MKIPRKGMSKEELFTALETYKTRDADWRAGRVFGYVYDAGREVEEVCKQAYMMFLSENALDFTVYPSVMRLENEVVAMAAAHLGGDKDVVGSFTTGGTESILLAVKAARDRQRALRPEIREPEMVMPVTAHAAFHKAAHYLDVKAVTVPVDPRTLKADVEAMRSAITGNTILLVGSSPSYAHGVIDPIVRIGELARERDLLFHVDACIGGFLLPYYRRLGEPVPEFDFRVPGVTSISMDLHKYAYAAKGASVVLYRDKKLRQFQLFSCSRWPGYIVVNSTVQSTKTAGPLAGAWAVLNFIGDEGYLELARRLLEGTRRIIAGIEAIEGLSVLGKPEMSLAAMVSDSVNLFRLADAMSQRGWYIQPQLACGGLPQNIHISVNPSNVDRIDEFLADLRECGDETRSLPPSGLAAMVVQAFADIDPAKMDEEVFGQMTAMAGIKSGELPEDMAEINEVLNALPTEVCERLLVQFVNDLFAQPK